MASKIKDGLFLGDAETSQDIDFLVSNKITHVINCCGTRVPNSWERIGLQYLTLRWPNSATFDGSEAAVHRLNSFIDDALKNCDTILVHSMDGSSRACAVVASFMMTKYFWNLDQTMGFLRSKRVDLNPLPPVVEQLRAIEQRLIQLASGDEELSQRLRTQFRVGVPWKLLPKQHRSLTTEDEEVLVNTFLNALASNQGPPGSGPIIASAMAPQVHSSSVHKGGRRKRRSTRLSWIDDGGDGGVGGGRQGMTPGRRRAGNGGASMGAERPPGSSYTSMTLGPGWNDTFSQMSGHGSQMSNPYSRYGVAGRKPRRGVNSPAGRSRTGAGHSPALVGGKLVSILKGSEKFRAQKELSAETSEVSVSDETENDASSEGQAESLRDTAGARRSMGKKKVKVKEKGKVAARGSVGGIDLGHNDMNSPNVQWRTASDLGSGAGQGSASGGVAAAAAAGSGWRSPPDSVEEEMRQSYIMDRSPSKSQRPVTMRRRPNSAGNPSRHGSGSSGGGRRRTARRRGNFDEFSLEDDSAEDYFEDAYRRQWSGSRPRSMGPVVSRRSRPGSAPLDRSRIGSSRLFSSEVDFQGGLGLGSERRGGRRARGSRKSGTSAYRHHDRRNSASKVSRSRSKQGSAYRTRPSSSSGPSRGYNSLSASLSSLPKFSNGTQRPLGLSSSMGSRQMQMQMQMAASGSGSRIGTVRMLRNRSKKKSSRRPASAGSEELRRRALPRRSAAEAYKPVWRM